MVKKNKFLGGKVGFDEPHFKKYIESNNHQVLKGCTKRIIAKVNRLPVFVQGSQIDIVDYVHSFLCKSLMQAGINNPEIKKKEDQIMI